MSFGHRQQSAASRSLSVLVDSITAPHGTAKPVGRAEFGRRGKWASWLPEKLMKRYLAVFTGSPSAMARWNSLPEAERQTRQAEGVAAWKRWATDNADAIVENGGPLSRTKLVSAAGIADVRNNLGAYIVVRAESQEDAARLFLNHPHFTLLAGEGVEIMQVLPIPAGAD